MTITRLLPRTLRWACGIAVAWTTATGWAADGSTDCRIAFDLGSSGIRAGSTESTFEPRMDLDVLAAVNSRPGIDAVVPHTAVALRVLRTQGRWPDCHGQVGVGFSAWRLSLQREPEDLIRALRDIRRASGVSLLVASPAQEGHYGYDGAQRALGGQLGGRHVLDIGGGSLQVTSPQAVFGVPLGQKAWHRLLCQALGRGDVVPCALQPMSDAEVASARRLADAQLQGLPQALGTPVNMTAITRPVSRGVAPAVHQLRRTPTADTLARTDLGAAIEAWAGQSGQALSAAAGLPPEHAGFLMSDMLLVEGLMRTARSDTLMVAEAEASNVRGILADDRAYRWADRYECYLDRLRTLGESAYASDPGTCPGRAARHHQKAR
ncbi:MAG TPA: hypothetical protein H9903_02635 [Candidatus Aquabacterium excrementipullorum]|nr:hypothetical protein [Candidatus Aquabacterium excrementipullorum]